MMVSPFKTESPDEYIQIDPNAGVASNELSISYRPFLFEFLEDMKNKFELIIYSSFNKFYHQEIINCLQSKKKYFSYHFDESFCIFANVSSSVKCIDFLLENRPPSSIIVVENSPSSLPLSIDNMVPISVYDSSNPRDAELIKLGSFLDYLSSQKDVTAAIKRLREEGKEIMRKK